MNTTVRYSLPIVVAFLCLLSAFAAAPAKLDDTAPVADIVLEVDGKIALLEKALASDESFEAAREKDVIQSFGVLACMGQALAEHTGHAEAKFSGPALREAALGFKADGGIAEAREALEAVKTARAGGGKTDAATEHDWDKLVDMHAMMEEVNARNAKLVPIFRRPRGRPEEAAHASTIAILALAMEADTSTVDGEENIALWQRLSREYREKMTEVATAVRAKDGKTAREHFDRANEICDQCHEKLRDAE
jgi:hypothetical protein